MLIWGLLSFFNLHLLVNRKIKLGLVTKVGTRSKTITVVYLSIWTLPLTVQYLKHNKKVRTTYQIKYGMYSREYKG